MPRFACFTGILTLTCLYACRPQQPPPSNPASDVTAPAVENVESLRTDHSFLAGTFAAGDVASCPYDDAGQLPPPEKVVNDSDIPQFNRRKARKSDMTWGSQFLQDHELHQHLLGVQGAIFACFDLATCYRHEPVAGGELGFEFWLEPNGHVSAVSVKPSRDLDDPMVVACARRSVYEYRFPTWDGGRMVVEYSMVVD